MRNPRKPGPDERLELCDVPSRAMEVARERTGPLLRWAARYGEYDLPKLVATAYLQGVMDWEHNRPEAWDPIARSMGARG